MPQKIMQHSFLSEGLHSNVGPNVYDMYVACAQDAVWPTYTI